MCDVLELPRSTYYYEAKVLDHQDKEISTLIVDIFKRSRNIYGQRKIKKELEKQGWHVSRRRISRISEIHNLNDLQMFHTDRGNEYKNKLIDQALDAFGIKRSLSEKGTPYDNAVAEAAFKTIKTAFVSSRVFPSYQVLELEFFDYVHWYNQIRIHGSLDYQSPNECKLAHLSLFELRRLFPAQAPPTKAQKFKFGYT